jgi:hypothetical protein
MFLSRSLPKALAGLALAAALPGLASAQGAYANNGGEYAITGHLPGDQVRPRASLNSTGGFLVWEDNITDGEGMGVSAVHLDGGSYADFAAFRINATLLEDQERPDVAVLPQGGAAFVWQGGRRGFQHIYARFLSPSGTFLSTNDLQVNTSSSSYQANPAIAALPSGNVIVTYASGNQFAADSMLDIYGQQLSATGEKVGSEFMINQFPPGNQRTPAIATLTDGRFVVAWVSELQGGDDMVSIYARLYNGNGSAVGREFRVDQTTNVCANPSIAAGPDGTFAVAWGQRDRSVRTNGWDILARTFSSTGSGGPVRTVNSFIFGDQYAPRIAGLPTGYFVVWTTLSQDGSYEGVYGRNLSPAGDLLGDEFKVNTTVASRQVYPTVAGNGVASFVAIWSGFVGGAGGMDLYAQRYLDSSQPLQPMGAPFVYVPFRVDNAGAYQPEIQVSWPAQAGTWLDHYEVYVNGSGPVASLTSNVWVMTAAQGLTANSSRSFQVTYVTKDMVRAPLSPATVGKTWMGGFSWGGVPIEWMSSYYGSDMSRWPAVGSAITPGGPTLLDLFLTGANPVDARTWLRTALVSSPQGYFLTWNPQPGLIYQVQTSSNLDGWTNVGTPRFAAGTTDSIFIGGNNTAYYRILKLR